MRSTLPSLLLLAACGHAPSGPPAGPVTGAPRPTPPAAQASDGANVDEPRDRRVFRCQLNDVLLIETATGERAVVQFTTAESRGSTYRWRYRGASSAEVLSGVDQVAEKYDRIPDGPGQVKVVPRPGQNTVVRAGGVRAQWSWGSRELGFLYYDPRRMTVKVVPRETFDTAL